MSPTGFLGVPFLAFAIPFQSSSGVLLESVRATANVRDAAASTAIEFVFRNSGTVDREEVFLFPLPDGSVASDLSLTVDGKPVAGEILDRDQARAVYTSIVRSRRDPALLEWVGSSCVRVSAFPIPANAEARLALRYATVLRAVEGRLEYRLPLRLSAFPGGAATRVVFDATIEASQPLGAVHSPTHALDLRRDGDRKVRATMEGSGDALGRDLRLLLAPAVGDFGFLFLTHRRPGEDGHFLAVFAPRVELEPEKVRPKDLVFVLDASGSMAGGKIEQAKGALRHALGRLNPGDRFSLIQFATESDAFRPEPVASSAWNLEVAQAWIAAIQAGGATNLEEALARSVSGLAPSERVPLVLFLTDGLPTVGVTDEKAILGSVRAKNAAGARIFVCGVGDDVNTRLLDTLADETRAAREYIRPWEDVEAKVAALVDKVSSPIVSDASFSLAGEAYDVYPKRPMDLFRGSSLVVVGRFRGEGRATFRVSGRVASGVRDWSYPVELPNAEPANDALRATWASRKVGYLLDEIRLHGEDAEVVDEIRRLGREYAIVTPYTSFLVREEGRRLAQARGIGGDEFRFAPSPGLARTSGGGGGALASAPSVPHVEGAAEEKKEAADSVGKLAKVGETVTGGNAVDESLTARDLKDGVPVREALRKDEESELTAEGSIGAGAGARSGSGVSPFSSRKLGSGGLGPKGRGGGATLSRGRAASRPAVSATESFVRRVGGKVFHLVGGVWIDAAFTEEAREKVVKVVFLSDGYFDLLAKEPGLAPVFALGPRVLVGWKGDFYETVESPP